MNLWKFVCEGRHWMHDGRIYWGDRASGDLSEAVLVASGFRTRYGERYIYLRIRGIGAAVVPDDKVWLVVPESAQVAARVTGQSTEEVLRDSPELAADVLRTLIVSSWVQEPEEFGCPSSNV